LFLALASATVLLVAVPSAGASRARTTKLLPPLIHESFTPLPCSGAPVNSEHIRDFKTFLADLSGN
jgi:hypothetical protein